MSWNSSLETQGAELPESLASPAELNPHAERARVGSEASAATFRSLGRTLWAPVAGWWERRATRAALMRCNDRVLADIGIERGDIPLVARGLDPMHEPAPASPVWRRAPAMLAHVEVLAMIWRGASHGWLGRHPQTVADRA